ncbi:MAG: lanthionine synthetase LanC family protein [Thermoanaerobaculia bacterium]
MPADAVSADLRVLVNAVRVLSATSYTVSGDHREIAPPEAARRPDVDPPAADDEREALIESLADDLYQHLYTRRGTGGGGRPDRLARRRHVARLSRANRGSGTWEPGWRIAGVEDDGKVAVVKDKVVFWARQSQVRARGGEIVTGEPCRLRIPEELLEELPGFYVAIGNADAPWDPTGEVLRLYWHLRSAAAVEWVGELTAALNAGGIPFRLKTLSDPVHYRRADAGVLYLQPAFAGAGRDPIRRVYRRVAAGLCPQVPMLTAVLAPGLAWAQGPAGGSSFGQHRCRLVAGALVETFERRQESFEERLRAVSAAYRRQGLDPRRPHLAAGSKQILPSLFEARHPTIAGSVAAHDPETGDAGSFLAAAGGLGDSLCRQAWWDRDRCNWIGHAFDRRDSRAPMVAALGVDLYGGAAGVGLFLAELYQRTGDEAHRCTAGGALRRVLQPAPVNPGELPALGFFNGRLGVAWAVRRAAALLADRDLTNRAEALLTELLEDVPDEHPLDLYGGNAGAILASLDLHRDTGESRFRAAAVTLGEEICSAAERDGAAWSWTNERLSGIEAEPMLTGFSHGAAGLGLALFELFAATGRESFLAGARGAFAYEDLHFDRERGNWPDFRPGGLPEAGRGASPDRPAFMIAWCHGAPGIALSRLLAMNIDPERGAQYEAAARAGLDTTVSHLSERLAEPDADASLCHGVCGLVDVLLIAADVLDESEFRRRAEDALRRLVAQHGDRGDWPSGALSRGPNPSLMLGEAGIGYVLLRCSGSRRLPSVLIPAAS